MSAVAREKGCLLLYTDGSAEDGPPPRAGWGWLSVIPDPKGKPARECTPITSQWGPVITDSQSPHSLGALKLTNNTGELSAIGHALQWASTCAILGEVAEIQIRTDSQWAIGALSGDRIKRNKLLVKMVKDILERTRALKLVTLIWIRGHQTNDSDVAYWNAEADRLAGLGMRGFTSDGVVDGARVPHYEHTPCDAGAGERAGKGGTGWVRARGPPRGGIG